MRNLTLILLLFIVTACGNEPSSNNTTNTTPPTTQGGGEVDEQYKKGKELFKAKCNVCHELNRKLTGPALAGIGQRRDKQWLYSFIRNNNELRKSGDAEAIAIYKKWNGLAMPEYTDLTNEQIDAIIYYCDTPKK